MFAAKEDRHAFDIDQMADAVRAVMEPAKSAPLSCCRAILHLPPRFREGNSRHCALWHTHSQADQWLASGPSLICKC